MAHFLAQLWDVLTRRIDSFLLGIALSIAGLGLITLFSASDQSMARLSSQAASLAFALVLMWIVANIPPQQLARAAVPLYVVASRCCRRRRGRHRQRSLAQLALKASSPRADEDALPLVLACCPRNSRSNPLEGFRARRSVIGSRST
jgi:hypothetical protein